MSNLTDNKLNLILAEDSVVLINKSINIVKDNIPTVGLTDEQRASLKSMDVDNKVFVEDVISVMAVNGAGIIPDFIKPEFIKNDLTLSNQLDSILVNLLSAVRLVTDAKRVADDEAYSLALASYKMFEMASLAGIPGAKEAYEKLKPRFDGQGNAGRKSDGTAI